MSLQLFWNPAGYIINDYAVHKKTVKNDPVNRKCTIVDRFKLVIKSCILVCRCSDQIAKAYVRNAVQIISKQDAYRKIAELLQTFFLTFNL